MRVQYQWTQRDWNEAVALANRREGKRETALPGLTWVVIVIPLIGAAGDLAENLQSTRQFSPADAVMPLLLVTLAVVAAAMFAAARRQRTRRLRQNATIPAGEQEAILQEAGWCFHNPAEAATALRPWSDVRETRRGNRVLVLMLRDGFEALPLGGLTPEQNGHMHRLVTRKLRPSPTES